MKGCQTLINTTADTDRSWHRTTIPHQSGRHTEFIPICSHGRNIESCAYQHRIGSVGWQAADQHNGRPSFPAQTCGFLFSDERRSGTHRSLFQRTRFCCHRPPPIHLEPRSYEGASTNRSGGQSGRAGLDRGRSLSLPPQRTLRTSAKGLRLHSIRGEAAKLTLSQTVYRSHSEVLLQPA